MIARLEIDLGAIRRNAARLRALVAPSAFAAVVKANAYGHGLVETARALAHDVDTLCVYRADEAATLRDAGFTAAILVLGPVEPNELSLVHDCRAAIAMWSKGSYKRDAARLARGLESPLGIHVKVDTGVTRLGLDADRATGAIAAFLEDPDFALGGVFTHLAAAEELESEFTHGQLARFRAATDPLRATLAERGVRLHAAASAAAMLYPQSRFDMIRAGIAVYGIWPSNQTRRAAGAEIDLEPALAWRTEIVALRTVEAGRSVGYGCTFHTSRESQIAVLPIGYAEGLPRALSNRGTVLVCGRPAPIVGRICMNMAFVDVTGIPNAAVGSRVTLIGRDGDAYRDANDLANDAGTIGYELVARLPREVPRRYVAESAPMASARSIVPS